MAETLQERMRREREGKARAKAGVGQVESTYDTPRQTVARRVILDGPRTVEFVTSEEKSETRVLHVASFGAQRSGKTRFPFTMLDVLAKGQKIFLTPIDKNSYATFLQLERELGHKGRVLYPKHELYTEDDIRQSMRYAKRAGVLSRKKERDKTDAEKEEQQAAQEIVAGIYRNVVDRVVDYIGAAVSRDEVGGGVVDTFTELYEFAQLGDFGKVQGNDRLSWASINREFMDIVTLCKRKQMVFVHAAGDEYKKNPVSGEREPTGRTVIDGWRNIGKATSVVMEHLKIDDMAKNNMLRGELGHARVGPNDDNDPLPTLPYFVVRPFESQANPWLNRKEHYLVNEDCTFAKLGELVYGDENWWKG